MLISQALITPLGLLDTNNIAKSDNVANGYPLSLRFYIDDQVNSVDKVFLRLTNENFRGLLLQQLVVVVEIHQDQVVRLQQALVALAQHQMAAPLHQVLVAQAQHQAEVVAPQHQERLMMVLSMVLLPAQGLQLLDTHIQFGRVSLHIPIKLAS